jgi:hypothetical protein
MNLDPFKVNGLGTNSFTQLDTVTSAMLTIGGRQVQEIWAILGEQ